MFPLLPTWFCLIDFIVAHRLRLRGVPPDFIAGTRQVHNRQALATAEIYLST